MHISASVQPCPCDPYAPLVPEPLGTWSTLTLQPSIPITKNVDSADGGATF